MAKIMKNYKFGFSLAGLILYVLQLLPNIIWVLAPPVNDALARNSSPYPIINVIERVFGFMTVAFLILVVNKNGGKNGRRYMASAALSLAAYYISWIFYYNGVVCPWLLVIGLAAMPPLYFIFAGIWMKNYAVVIPGVIFGITHIAITCVNYL